MTFVLPASATAEISVRQHHSLFQLFKRILSYPTIAAATPTG
jgi:hypothetical protein